MKKTIICFVVAVALFAAGTDVFAVRQTPSLEGRVLDETGAPVGYATVVLLSGDTVEGITGNVSEQRGTSGQVGMGVMEQAAGDVTDEQGRFSLAARAGTYTLKVLYMGYEDYERQVKLESSAELPDIILTPSTQQIDALRVTGRAIVREADRFVVTVANSVGAVGKDAFEFLRTVPAVWINGTDITINGRSGTRVMVNDRLLRQTGEDLEAYLRSIKAEDVLKVEIIPVSGAEYDAETSGGVISITLAKRRNDGLDGNVTLAGGGNVEAEMRQFYPSFGLNYQSGRLNLYGNANFNYFSSMSPAYETTNMRHPSLGEMNTVYDAISNGLSRYYGGRVGGVYDIDSLSSVGAELGIYGNNGNQNVEGRTDFSMPEVNYHTENIYKSESEGTNYFGTMNYIRKLDGKGSTFKLIGDYAGSFGRGSNDSRETYFYPDTAPTDTLGRQSNESRFNIYSLNANLDLVRSAATVLKMGAKYTYNDIYSPINAEGMGSGQTEWSHSEQQSSVTDYAENIGALYFIYNSRFGKLGLSAGLRVEYSHMNSTFREAFGDPDPMKQSNDYFDFFPNVNLSLPLSEDYSNSLVLSYSRTIARPQFHYLRPFRIQLSPNSYILGNPDLKPTYNNTIQLTGVFAHKYSLTLGTVIEQNQIRQELIPESGNANVLVYKYMNIPSAMRFFASLNAPINITDRWSANVNVTALQQSQKLSGQDSYSGLFSVFGGVSTNLEIPKWFDVEVSYYYMSKLLNANMEIMPMHHLSAGIKKRFADNKFTASLNVGNMLSAYQQVHSFGGDPAGWMFDRWADVNTSMNWVVTLSLRYNFNMGIKFRARTVERGASDDVNRLGGEQ